MDKTKLIREIDRTIAGIETDRFTIESLQDLKDKTFSTYIYNE